MSAKNLYIYYDFMCPYCRISGPLVAKLTKELTVMPVWNPFSLTRDIPEQGLSWQLTVSEMEGFRESVERKSKEWGLDVNIPAFRVNSMLALQAGEFAKEQGCFDEFQQRTYNAYWVEGLNIGVLSVVLDIASSLGLDTKELTEHLHIGTYQQILEQNEAKMHTLPYVAIPTFIIGKYRVYGLQDYEVLRRAVELAIDSQNSSSV